MTHFWLVKLLNIITGAPLLCEPEVWKVGFQCPCCSRKLEVQRNSTPGGGLAPISFFIWANIRKQFNHPVGLSNMFHTSIYSKTPLTVITYNWFTPTFESYIYISIPKAQGGFFPRVTLQNYRRSLRSWGTPTRPSPLLWKRRGPIWFFKIESTDPFFYFKKHGNLLMQNHVRWGSQIWSSEPNPLKSTRACWKARKRFLRPGSYLKVIIFKNLQTHLFNHYNVNLVNRPTNQHQIW